MRGTEVSREGEAYNIKYIDNHTLITTMQYNKQLKNTLEINSS